MTKMKNGHVAISRKAFTLVNPVTATDADNVRARTSNAPITKTSRLFTLNPLPTTAIIPSTKVIWLSMEPKESPKSMSPCPLQHETIELEISGRSVPIETSTSPIMRGEIPGLRQKRPSAQLLCRLK